MQLVCPIKEKNVIIAACKMLAKSNPLLIGIIVMPIHLEIRPAVRGGRFLSDYPNAQQSPPRIPNLIAHFPGSLTNQLHTCTRTRTL